MSIFEVVQSIARSMPEIDGTINFHLEMGTGNGEWGMGNGEMGMGNGEWGMGHCHEQITNN
jgi:hypothetical protein